MFCIEAADYITDGRAAYDIDAICAEAITTEYDPLTFTIEEDDEGESDGPVTRAFWDLVQRHERPQFWERHEADQFRTVPSGAIARQSRTDRDAIWTDGTTTVRVRGVSRVNQELPQPTAEFRIEAADSTVALPDPDAVTWDLLWAAVRDASTTAQTTKQVAASRLRDAARKCAQADQAQADALAQRNALVQELTWMPAEDVAAELGLRPSSVYKILGKQ